MDLVPELPVFCPALADRGWGESLQEMRVVWLALKNVLNGQSKEGQGQEG